MVFKYWQCPNDESHELHQSWSRFAGAPRCKVCPDTEAVMDYHPTVRSTVTPKGESK